jgi:bifunctional DNA-binding transcriptional regulator/antitoxin component of YhaV-PrlF toxin-antitoxin module
MRAFSRINSKSQITIPGNIYRAAGLKNRQLVELKIIGTSKSKSILVSPRKDAR